MSALLSGGWAGTASIDDIQRGHDRVLVTLLVAEQSPGHLGQQAGSSSSGQRSSSPWRRHRRRFDGGVAGIAAMLLVSVLLGVAIGALSHAIALLTRTQRRSSPSASGSSCR
jgi:ABC-2 type transport system permease protein